MLARTKKGTKPDFHGAADPEVAKKLYEYFVNQVKKEYDPARVGDGRFQAMMEVGLVNDGPVSDPLLPHTTCHDNVLTLEGDS